MRPVGGAVRLVGVRCLIVDDNARFLVAARGLLERQGMTVAGVATTGMEALFLAEELHPDVTLVDIDLGPESGFDLARELARTAAATPVILISTHTEEDFAGLIETSPAIGFLPKTRLSAGAVRDLVAGDGEEPGR
jgi:DNA-binding response OmpR family regulator